VAGSDAVCGVEIPGRAVLVAADYPCDLDFWRACLAKLGVEPRLRHDATDPGLLVTSTMDTSGQCLLHLLNVGPTDATFSLSYRGRLLLDGRRLHVPARAGAMLPYGVRVGPATLLETTCELISRTGAEVVLRPTQGARGDIAIFDREPVSVSGAKAAGRVVTTTSARPVRVRFGGVACPAR
jgi:beta-galactosidase